MTKQQIYQEIESIFKEINVNESIRLSSIDINKTIFLIKNKNKGLYIHTYTHRNVIVSKPIRRGRNLTRSQPLQVKVSPSSSIKEKVDNLTTKDMFTLLQTLKWIKQYY